MKYKRNTRPPNANRSEFRGDLRALMLSMNENEWVEIALEDKPLGSMRAAIAEEGRKIEGYRFRTRIVPNDETTIYIQKFKDNRESS